MILHRTIVVALIALVAGAISGCAEFSEWISFGDEEERAEARAEAERSSLWEMTLMAGRYGTMLGQAREILNLPEPQRPAADTFPTDATDVKKQREALAAYQARVTNEFLADADGACKRRKVPSKLRSLACEQQKKVPGDLRAPVQPEFVALAARNQRVGEVITPWWDAVCAVARKPRDGEAPVCAME